MPKNDEKREGLKNLKKGLQTLAERWDAPSREERLRRLQMILDDLLAELNSVGPEIKDMVDGAWVGGPPLQVPLNSWVFMLSVSSSGAGCVSLSGHRGYCDLLFNVLPGEKQERELKLKTEALGDRDVESLGELVDFWESALRGEDTEKATEVV